MTVSVSITIWLWR